MTYYVEYLYYGDSLVSIALLTMTNLNLMFWTIIIVCTLLYPSSAKAQPTTLYLTDAPVWIHYFCDGSEPDPNGSARCRACTAIRT